MIKEINEEASSNKYYEIYAEDTALNPEGETVTIMKVIERVYLEQLNQEIAELTARLADRQSILDQINNL